MAASDGGTAPLTSVELRVRHIRRSDLLSLQQLLGTYMAAWRLNQARGADSAADPLLSGRLQLDVTRLFEDGVVVWLDTLAPVAGCSGQCAAGAGPRYERATGELLAPAHKDSSLRLPGGLAAAKRRAQAEASAVGWVGAAGAAASDAAGLEAAAHGGAASAATPMRQRVPLGRCFNCGSYEHDHVSKCPVPICMERVSAARAERAAELSAAGASGFRLKQRYFEEGGGGGGSDKQRQLQQDLAPQPGRVSQELADALGMPSVSSPPPWLCRMVALGVSPAYLPAEEEEQPPEQEPLLTWHDGGSEEGGEAAVASGDVQLSLDDGGDGGQPAAVNGDGGQPAAVNGVPAAAAAAALPAAAPPGYMSAVATGEPPLGTVDVLPWQAELARGRLLAQQIAAAP